MKDIPDSEQKKSIKNKRDKVDELHIDYVPLYRLHPNTYNPNKQQDYAFKLLCLSMKEQGCTEPILALPDGTIVDGEHRWRAAEKLGFTTIPVVYIRMTEEQMRITTLRRNRSRGEEDLEKLGLLLQSLESEESLEKIKKSLCMSEEEINELITLSLQTIQEEHENAETEFVEIWDTEKQHEDNKLLVSLKENNTLSEKEKSLEDETIEHPVYRILLGYIGKEAEEINTVLGQNPTKKLLELAKEKIGNDKVVEINAKYL